MKVDIWSDVRCPFCYIGKRKFEMALERFPHKNKVEVNWHSFQLDPSLQTQKDKNSYDHFSEIKGFPRSQAVQMHNHAAEIGREAGITIDFDKTVVANSFNAHRLIQLAKIKNLASEAEEQLFKAHFTDGRNIDDIETLVGIGTGIGLDETELKEVFASRDFADEVEKDESAARVIGVRSVPFFVFNYQYIVTGAQSPDTFLQVLDKSWNEFEKENVNLTAGEGDACMANGTCG